MKRLFQTRYVFSNGLEIPKATYVRLPSYAIENDPGHTVDPEKFDGLLTMLLQLCYYNYN